MRHCYIFLIITVFLNVICISCTIYMNLIQYIAQHTISLFWNQITPKHFIYKIKGNEELIPLANTLFELRYEWDQGTQKTYIYKNNIEVCCSFFNMYYAFHHWLCKDPLKTIKKKVHQTYLDRYHRQELIQTTHYLDLRSRASQIWPTGSISDHHWNKIPIWTR